MNGQMTRKRLHDFIREIRKFVSYVFPDIKNYLAIWLNTKGYRLLSHCHAVRIM